MMNWFKTLMALMLVNLLKKDYGNSKREILLKET